MLTGRIASYQMGVSRAFVATKLVCTSFCDEFTFLCYYLCEENGVLGAIGGALVSKKKDIIIILNQDQQTKTRSS